MRTTLWYSLAIILLLIMTSGCINEDNSVDTPEESHRTTTNHSNSGEGHLEEMETDSVFSYTLENEECLISMICNLVWEDEAPVDRPIQYENEGDYFMVTITNGANVSVINTARNIPGYPGNIICRYQGDGMDWEVVTRPMTIFVEIELVFAGDQYPYHRKDEATKVEDTGNDYSWTVDYTLMV